MSGGAGKTSKEKNNADVMQPGCCQRCVAASVGGQLDTRTQAARGHTRFKRTHLLQQISTV